MGSSNTGSAIRNTFGGGSSGQSRATGFGNLFTDGSIFSDSRDFLKNPSAFLGLSNSGGDEEDPLAFDEANFDEFNSRLNQFNDQFFNADLGSESLFDIASTFRNRSEGSDPSFERFRDSQFNIFEAGAEEERSNAAANLARLGILNSSTGVNELNKVDRNLNFRKEALGSQIGLQDLNRRDQNLLNAAAVTGQAGAARDLELSSISAGLENLLAPEALKISRIAAINAGKLPPEQEEGLFGKIFDGLF